MKRLLSVFLVLALAVQSQESFHNNSQVSFQPEMDQPVAPVNRGNNTNDYEVTLTASRRIFETHLPPKEIFVIKKRYAHLPGNVNGNYLTQETGFHPSALNSIQNFKDNRNFQQLTVISNEYNGGAGGDHKENHYYPFEQNSLNQEMQYQQPAKHNGAPDDGFNHNVAATGTFVQTLQQQQQHHQLQWVDDSPKQEQQHQDVSPYPQILPQQQQQQEQHVPQHLQQVSAFTQTTPHQQQQQQQHVPQHLQQVSAFIQTTQPQQQQQQQHVPQHLQQVTAFTHTTPQQQQQQQEDVPQHLQQVTAYTHTTPQQQQQQQEDVPQHLQQGTAFTQTTPPQQQLQQPPYPPRQHEQYLLINNNPAHSKNLLDNLLDNHKYVSQSEAAQLDAYPYKQVAGFARTFMRTSRRCYASGECKNNESGPGASSNTDFYHESILKQSKPKIEPQAKKFNYIFTGNPLTKYVVKAERCIKKESQLSNRRLSPYSEILIPQYPFD